MFRLAFERAIDWWQDHTDDILGWDLEPPAPASLGGWSAQDSIERSSGDVVPRDLQRLVEVLEPATYYGKCRVIAERAERFREHPHRAPLGVARSKRRPGSVPPRSAHCISPISPVRSDHSAGTTASLRAPEAH